MTNDTSLLIIGGPNSGKTHYGAQLLGRLRGRGSSLQLRKTVGDITPFEQALTCLADGRSADHTSTEIYHEVELSLGYEGGTEAVLLWPDYGGEQIRQMIEQRHISRPWLDRIQRADSWILFLRLSITRTYDDLISRPLHEVAALQMGDNPNDEADYRWDDQALYIELLQFLLFARHASTLRPITKPRLMMLLSCWDELPGTEDVSPEVLLQKHMPMLADYIDATWSHDAATIIGLSSLGKALSRDTSDDEYLDKGPENLGYVVLPDSSKQPDLTLPIALLIASPN